MKQLLGVLILVSAFGCGGKDSGGSEARKRNNLFADQMCACTDAACATKVTNEWTKAWDGKQKELFEAEEAEKTKIDEAQKRMTDCALKAQGMTK